MYIGAYANTLCISVDISLPDLNGKNVVIVEDIIDFVPKGKTGDVEKVTRCMKLMDISENCDYIRVWISPALSIEDKGVWYPQWIFDKILEKLEL